MNKIKQDPSSSQHQNSHSPAADRASSLPCLNSNNTAEILENSIDLLTPYHRKQAFSLKENCSRFISMFGLSHVGFLTLTFPDNVVDNKEAYRRFCSFRKHFLTKVFSEYMLVKERQKRGAWHYHLLVAVSQDIRTGFDFDQVFPGKGKRPSYKSAAPYLRNLWSELREALPKYGFGRSELAPIRTNDEAMAKYVGKYIEQNVVGKNVSGYEEQDKGVRLISYSRTWPRTSTKFSWNSPGSKEWRRKLERFTIEFLGLKNTDDLKEEYGPRWAYLWTDYIIDIDVILEDSLNTELKRSFMEKNSLHRKPTPPPTPF